MDYHSVAMASAALPSLFARLVGIVIAGALGALAGWTMTAALQWSGLAAALVALAIGMTVATGVFAAWVLLLQALGRR
jgi:hypothetical protein